MRNGGTKASGHPPHKIMKTATDPNEKKHIEKHMLLIGFARVSSVTEECTSGMKGDRIAALLIDIKITYHGLRSVWESRSAALNVNSSLLAGRCHRLVGSCSDGAAVFPATPLAGTCQRPTGVHLKASKPHLIRGHFEARAQARIMSQRSIVPKSTCKKGPESCACSREWA